MKALTVGLAVLFFFVLAGTLLAQPTLNVRVVNRDLEVFFLKDFDVNNPASGPPIFFVDITNDSQPRRVLLILKVNSQRRGNLGIGRTLPFELSAFESLSLSNNNLFSVNDPHRLDEFRIEDVANDLLNDILATGRLPTDTYQFEIELRDVENPSTMKDEQFEIEVTNPNTLDLIFPGHPASGQIRDCPEIFTNLPQFRWESDMRRFRVIIAEARPGEDPESALVQDPRFVRTFVIGSGTSVGGTTGGTENTGRVETLPSTSFQYPASGEILTLKPGHAYYWRVIGIIETSSGEDLLKSEIYCFRVASLDESLNRTDLVVRRLLTSLGIDADQLFGEGGELEGYHAKRIYLNGKPVTVPELLRKFNEIRTSYSGYKIENQ